MINSKIINVKPESYSIINVLITVVYVVIFSIIGWIGISLIPQLNIYSRIFTATNLPLYILAGIVVTILFVFISSYIEAIAYNYLLKYMDGIQIELTPNNEIKKIDIVPTALILSVISMIMAIIMGLILLVLSYTVLMQIPLFNYVLHSTGISSMILVALVWLVLMIILSFVATFISLLIIIALYNVLASKYPVKITIEQSTNGLEIKNVDIISLIISYGLSLGIFNVITQLYLYLVSPNIVINIYSILSMLISSIIFVGLTGILYNLMTKIVKGYQFDLIASNNNYPHPTEEYHPETETSEHIENIKEEEIKPTQVKENIEENIEQDETVEQKMSNVENKKVEKTTSSKENLSFTENLREEGFINDENPKDE